MPQLEPTYRLSQKTLVAQSIQPEAHMVPQQMQTGIQKIIPTVAGMIFGRVFEKGVFVGNFYMTLESV